VAARIPHSCVGRFNEARDTCGSSGNDHIAPSSATDARKSSDGKTPTETSRGIEMSKQALDQYVLLTAKLCDLINKGMGDSDDADRLRDEMDPLWYALSEEEEAEARNQCVKLSKT
jgi:hypothetical protein